MEISPLSDRSVAEEKEEAFVGSTPRRKKRSLAARRAALRPWAVGGIVDHETWWRTQEILDITERVKNTSDSTKRKHLVLGLFRVECG